MSAELALPEASVLLAEKPCVQCGMIEFSLYTRGPHIGRVCVKCGTPGGWVTRAEVGLGKRNIRREPIPFDTRAEVLQRWKHRCAWCGVSAQDAMLQIGHIVPRAQVEKLQGEALADHELNLAPTCETCNAGAHLTHEYAFDLLLTALRLAASK